MPTNPVKKAVGGSGRFIRDRKVEILIGVIAFAVGCLLLWDAFDGRGKRLPWPANKIAPW